MVRMPVCRRYKRDAMINPGVLATRIAAMLLACFLCGGSEPGVAGPISALSEVAATPLAATHPATEPRGRVYLFRGALGPIFSRGMDRLTEQIENAGVIANVYEFTICHLIAERAITVYRENPAPIILIGHSMGGFCALKFAEMLQAENIPVKLVVTVDPAHVTPSVPLNVERYINIYLSKDVLGGGDVKPQQGYQGCYASFDLSEHDEVSHINIDKMDAVHRQLVGKIVQLATTPAVSACEAVPLRYVVPPNAAIELWDSGMQVFARPGDTLQTLAELYRVPLWSLIQINKGADKAPLVPGERVVVPRHLLPLAEVAGQSHPVR